MEASEELLSVLKDHPAIHKSINEIFTKPESALSWLNKPRPQLLGKTPLEVTKTEPEKVEDLIYRIKTGDFS
ncbi:Protein of unknown function [Colwellia chukchiensis]|uniref:Antitoxin Xre/MbcA/ParS-like toxin-binding domain-containing protein n=1 Tax=Colwellia chukchiensis TaxID=641665 RepID=A0A1H7TZF5_9GAMM|nr:MbcA/ParS/Xre antitoxin family protein [Colwellia chukchiensis]SEL89935.1 Protein of unknown function [Colwellia chukchiensis]